jgi:phosphomannomutase
MQGVPGEPVNLTNEVMKTLGKAFARWLWDRGFDRPGVAIGRDPRLSGPPLRDALAAGLISQGVNVMDFGLASTPAMFMSTLDESLGIHGAVMLTASHLPYNRNGMKFFTSEGGFDKADIEKILEIAHSGQFDKPLKEGKLGTMDYMASYSGLLVDVIRREVKDPDRYDQPLGGLKIIVDAGNGAGGFFAEKVLDPLGADIKGSQFLEPDGTFPNHIPNPEAPEAMDAVCDAVQRENADLGIIFDTDVDRSAIVDADGMPVNRNDLIALISAVILEEHPGSVIVTDSITSDGLRRFIEEKLGGIHHRFKRGYRNVINEAQRLNREGKECWLAIETSGHAALRENHFLDDGAFLVAKLLIRMARMKREGKNLTSLIRDLARPAEAGEFRLGIRSPNFLDDGKAILGELEKRTGTRQGWAMESPNFEGIRVKAASPDESGWFLLRMSLHDPVMPLNIESDVQGGVRRIATHLYELLKSYESLELEPLETYLN